MILELGHFALALALAIALIQFIVPLAGAIRGDRALAALGPPAATLQGLLVIIAFGSLMHAYATSDFSVANVFENSHSLQPFIYKLTSVWGNHEGSMMLWLLVLSVFGAALALGSRDMPLPLRAATLAFQGLLAFAFILFILFTSNPFTRLASAPFEGRDLNPILQDPGLAIHPPMLYFGYVGFSIVFSFAAAALVLGRVDAAWARYVRPWILGAWIFLTLGIAMGSYWAYYILGWGGFWFWDPVENASLMPWLAGTALLHSAIVLEKRGALKVWTILLAILTFSLSLMGTFIVRSGILTSVHTFASDPTRGLFILLILVAFVGGSLVLFAWRAPLLSERRPFRAGFAGRRAHLQQPLPFGLLPHGLHRHALSAGARGADRRQDLCRPALFRCDHAAADHSPRTCHSRSARIWPGSAASCSVLHSGWFLLPVSASSSWL